MIVSDFIFSLIWDTYVRLFVSILIFFTSSRIPSIVYAFYFFNIFSGSFDIVTSKIS
jgi:hypothetical protein